MIFIPLAMPCFQVIRFHIMCFRYGVLPTNISQKQLFHWRTIANITGIQTFLEMYSIVYLYFLTTSKEDLYEIDKLNETWNLAFIVDLANFNFFFYVETKYIHSRIQFNHATWNFSNFINFPTVIRICCLNYFLRSHHNQR